MKEETSRLLEKAQRAIKAAENLHADALTEFAVGRAYYAMFYTAEALLNEIGFSFSKHGGVHGAFGEQFVKTGLFDAKYHRWLLDAFDRRIVGDYSVDEIITGEEVEEMISQSHQFLRVVRHYFDVLA